MDSRNTLKPLKELPDVSFIDNDTVESLMARLVTNYEKRYKEITGIDISLSASDPMRVALYAVALDLLQLEEYVDRAGKQDLLKYSYGEYLDNIAAARGVNREQPAPATVTVRFTASETREYALAIPQGTRVSNGGNLYFITEEYAEIPSGQPYIDVHAICTQDGPQGNGYLPGQINVLVDPLPYIGSVSNVTTSSGGQSLESDESLAERAYLAPSSFSVAGPDGAYLFWTRTYNPSIGSVKVASPSPCEVEIYILMEDGSIPNEEVKTGLDAFLQDEKIRPLTDHVTVKTPTVKTFDIDLRYYINRSESTAASSIQERVKVAVEEYKQWQITDIGKDINPSELIRRVVAAGAKRVEVTSPVFTRVEDKEVAQCGSVSTEYGGLEND